MRWKLWQDMKQEAPDELMRIKAHRLPTASALHAVVLPAERDAGIVGCNETAVQMATRCVQREKWHSTCLGPAL
jgi:hypothetical protein